MKNIKYISTLMVLLCGCGGAAGNNFSDDAKQNTAGDAGAEDVGSAGKMDDSAGQNSGGESGTAGTGGSMNSSGAGGIGNIAGQAGNSMAGSAGMNNIAGSSGMTGVCSPITCDDYTAAHGDPSIPSKHSCGSIDDGCGHKLNCGECDDFTKCGAEDMVTESSTPDPTTSYTFTTPKNKDGTAIKSDPNICNGACVYPKNPVSDGNQHGDGYPRFYCGNETPGPAQIRYYELVCFNPAAETSTMPKTNCLASTEVYITVDKVQVQVQQFCCQD